MIAPQILIARYALLLLAITVLGTLHTFARRQQWDKTKLENFRSIRERHLVTDTPYYFLWRSLTGIFREC